MVNLLEIDKAVFAWINTGWSNSAFDLIMPWITHLGDGSAVWLWIVLISGVMGWRLARSFEADQGGEQPREIIKTIVFFCLCMALIYGVNAGVYKGLKRLSHRPRPYVQQTVTLRVSSTTASGLRRDSSFPSGHASNAFVVAALLAGRLRRRRYAIYGAAALVALSRVYLGVHYPSDILVGSCLGLFLTWLMLAAIDRRSRRLRPYFAFGGYRNRDKGE